MFSASVTSFGRAFHRRVPSGRIHAGMPKSARMVRGTGSLLGVAGPSACRCLYDMVRCQDINKTMKCPVHHGDAGLRAAFR